MTIGIMPESDRKGRAVCQFWLQGGKHNVTPTDKNPSDESHPGDLLTPLFGRYIVQSINGNIPHISDPHCSHK